MYMYDKKLCILTARMINYLNCEELRKSLVEFIYSQNYNFIRQKLQCEPRAHNYTDLFVESKARIFIT